EPGPGPDGRAKPLLLLPLLLLPPHVLADARAQVARTGGRSVPTATRVHGLPTVPRDGVAVRFVRTAQVLSRFPFLARPVLVPDSLRVFRFSSRQVLQRSLSAFFVVPVGAGG